MDSRVVGVADITGAPKHQVPVVFGVNGVVEALESGLVPLVSDTVWLPSRSLLEAEHDEGSSRRWGHRCRR